MEPMVAMMMFGSAMGAVPFGGSVSAIMLNTPGTPQNIATCFDGYPLAQKGKAGLALGASLTASPLGTIVGLVVLALLIPVVRRVILSFGPPEFTLLVFLGVIALALLTKGNAVKGLISGGIGFLLAFIGFFSMTGETRFALGIRYLEDGIGLIPPAIGIFAIAEAINLSLRKGKAIARIGQEIKPPDFAQVIEGVLSVFRHWSTFLRSSLMGTLIGLIPALGGAVANILVWTTAAQTSRRGRYFGTGEIEGVVAAESANDAKDGGALLPTVGFGVPGSAEMAILLGAFILHGLVPGPQLLKEDVSIVWALILALIFGSFLAAGIGLATAKYIVRVTTIRGDVVATIVLFVSLLGSYAFRGSILDALLALLFGFIGYFMIRYDFSRPT
jgi:putative tricarboxylic transport membrane protein